MANPRRTAESRHFRMHIPMHSDITLRRAGETLRSRQPSLAIVMSVRCARRRDLLAVIACKHPCGGNTTKDVSSLFYLFSRSRARRHDELIHPARHQTRRTPGRVVLSGGRRRRQEFSRVLDRRARMHSGVSALGCEKSLQLMFSLNRPSADVSDMCNEGHHATRRNVSKFRCNMRKLFSSLLS